MNVFVPLKFVIQDYFEVSDIFSVVYGSVTNHDGRVQMEFALMSEQN